MAGRGSKHSHSSLGRARPCSVDVSSEEQLELEGSRKGWPLCFLVESVPSDKWLSVENHSGSAEDRSEAARLFVKRTVLISKPGCVGKPDQYRSITCLNTGYKLLTAVITTLLRQHVDKHSIFPAEQRVLQKEKYACLDALLVDSMVNEEVRHRRKKLSVAWVDYSKALEWAYSV